MHQGVSAGGVDGDIGNGVAVGIGEGSLGVHGDHGIGVEHALVGFLEDGQIHHHSAAAVIGGLLGAAFGSLLRGLRSVVGLGVGGVLRGGFGGVLFSAAACQETQNRGQGQHQCKKLFHDG